MKAVFTVFLICLHTTYCRDFYMGMFRKNDFLVAADELHKPRVPSRFTFAQYGRAFKCPITYFRVVDRLGTNIMPRVEVLRGGLLKKYIVVRFSVYNRPISVNIYVGCENKKKIVMPKRTKATTAAVTKSDGGADEDKGKDTGGTTGGAGNGTAATAAGGTGAGDGATTVGGGGEGAGAEGDAGAK